ncbi:MAG: ATP-binding protein [Spirochaetaceae bacterium]|nr:MAG: ATP-binding protein [Spirochaetaceae bacterium]
MPGMYARLLRPPESSIFLFGPRGTGKSTWIREHFPGAVTYNLLDTREALRLERDPHALYDELRTLPADSWVVIDEVQKVPALLDEVHNLIESEHLRFVLCGSSARKLKRSGTNLLAGRAIVTEMFPLTSAELGGDFDPSEVLVRGSLPLAVAGTDAQGFLSAYAMTYLNEEIRAEALTRNVGAFSRFLEVAARQNGQITNMTNISREAAVARTTVQTYFDILVDTLIGYWVPAWKLKHGTRHYLQSKFYLFDTGVARVLSGRIAYPPTAEETGPLFEAMLFNEVRAYLSYSGLRYQPHYWRTYDGTEVDFVCETREGFVGIEMKSTTDWLGRYGRGLSGLRDALSPAALKCYGVFRGARTTMSGETEVLPVRQFLNRLWQGSIIR